MASQVKGREVKNRLVPEFSGIPVRNYILNLPRALRWREIEMETAQTCEAAA